MNRVSPELALASADPDWVGQVLNNLLSNALKFTPSGGTVTVEGSSTAAGVRVTVTDTGIGIAPSDLHKLFTPFSQIDQGDARRYRGTGLGLSICKKLVELMEGTVGVTSEPGSGSTFFFTLPAASDRPSSAPRGLRPTFAPPPAPEGVNPVGPLARVGRRARTRILIVDDAETNRRVAAAMLQRFRCDVIEAADALSGHRLASMDAPSVILMDLQMPGTDGLTATLALKADPTTAAIPVIAVTAHAMAGDSDRALAAGCIAHVSKPIARTRLYEAIDLALNGAGWRAEYEG
jgi:CheY-like chemotaxis protein